MKLQYILTLQSSNILGICYDETKQELFVQFKNKRAYIYRKVPKETYDNLMSAESQGVFFAKEIKNSFDYLGVTTVIREVWAKNWKVVNPKN